MNKITPVILCGGGGTRLWPKSRPARPKPFLKLIGEQTLFEAALARCAAVEQFAAPVIVSGRAHLAHVTEQLGGNEQAQLIVEPAAKNTAAAIALAAERSSPDAILLVCPSDHHIADTEEFQKVAGQAAELARDGWLVSFGIKPTAPETGYGYLKQGERLGVGHRIERFVEKPDLARASLFLEEGGYSWNGGIFVFAAGAFMAELRAHRPQLAKSVQQAVTKGRTQGRQFHPDTGAFAMIESESVDYAVMENTDKAAMVAANMGWSDIGNWRALHQARGSDAAGNSVTGRADLVDCRRVQVDSDGPRVSAIGLSDVSIVIDGDEVLVVGPGGDQTVGQLPGTRGQ